MPHRQVIVAQFRSVRRIKTLPADVALATRARHVMCGCAALGLLDGRAAPRAVLGARTLLDPLQGHTPAP